MPPITPPNVTDQEGAADAAAPGEEQDNPTPQFQLVLRTTDGDNVIAASDTVNDLVDQAKYWLQASPTGAQLVDSQVRSIILQELDPKTGAYVDGQELPVTDKADVLTQARKLGARS